MHGESEDTRGHRGIHSMRTVGVAAAAVAATVIAVMTAMLPTASAQTVEGDIAITASRADPGVAQVDFAIQNSGDRARVQIDEIRLPEGAVPTAACRAEFRGSTQAVTIDPSGVVVLPMATLDMPAMSALVVSCRFEVGSLCDLEGTAMATWTGSGAPLFDRSAAAPVTPACKVESDDGRGGAFATLTVDASIESAPVGSVVIWTITAENYGSRRLTDAEFAVPLPAALEFDPASEIDPVMYDEATRTVHARFEQIRQGDSKSIRFRTRIAALSLIPLNASLETGQRARAVAEGRVFGLAAVPTPTPEPQAERERPRQQDRPRAQGRLAHTGTETPFVAVIGMSLLAAGVMITTTVRRR